MTFHLLQKRAWSDQRGLTLLELLVVLSILAVLSTVALTSSSGIADQARYEATQRTLENIREAIIGQPNMMDTDGTPLRSGFVADMGRLPRALSEPAPGGGTIFTLGELLQNTTSMQPYATLPAIALNIDVPTGSVAADEEDPDVVLGIGWRGPYLQLAPGNLVVRDGWGLELVTPLGVVTGYPHARLNTLAGTPVAVTTDEIAQVISFGQDDEPGGAVGSYNADVMEVIQDTDYQATEIRVPVTVRSAGGNLPLNSTVNVAVRFFTPNGDNGRLFVATFTSPEAVTDASTWAFTATFAAGSPTGTPIPTVGPRAMRAYYHATLPASYANTTGAPSATKGQSVVAYLTIRPGANVRSLFINLP